MSALSGQVAIVTGGAQGIGGAVADRLHDTGARLVIWDMDADLAAEKAAALGSDALAVTVDVGDWDSVSAALAQTLDATGRIDILVNSAGVAGPNETVENYPVDIFADIMRINALGTFHVNKAVVPAMRAQNYGRIVNIASIAGKDGNPNASAYSAPASSTR